MRFTNAMQRLALVFSKNLVPELIEEYREVLSAYKIEQIEAACESCRHEEKFFPKPVMITEYIRSLPIDESRLIPEESTMTEVERYQSFLVMKCVLGAYRRDEAIPTRAQQCKFVIDHWNDDWKWRGIGNTPVPLKDDEPVK